MHSTHIGGVDPGIVHTGVVGIEFDQPNRLVTVRSIVAAGAKPEDAAAEAAQFFVAWGIRADHTWIEQYRDRGNLNSNSHMHNAVRLARFATGGKILDNTGIKKVITDDLMKLIGCWKFSTPTHHQDLRSAARIALLGYVKTEHGNALVADIVRDHLNGRTWDVAS